MIEISKAIIKKDNRFLLLKRRPDSQTFPDTWDLPGGKHDEGESPRQAVVRETREETGYDIDPGEEIKKDWYRDGDAEYLYHYFITHHIQGELRLSTDHTASLWLTMEEMKGYPLHPSVRTYFLMD